MTDLISIIKEVGLSENQANLYLAGLELGTATISELSRKSGIKRTTVYPTLEELLKDGFFSFSLKGEQKLYLAENPENIVKKVKERDELLAHHLPELKSIYNLSPPKQLPAAWRSNFTLQSGLISGEPSKSSRVRKLSVITLRLK